MEGDGDHDDGGGGGVVHHCCEEVDGIEGLAVVYPEKDGAGLAYGYWY